MRTIVGVGSDFHGGSRFGLMNPNVVLYSEDKDGNLTPWRPAMTATQAHLWKLYLSGLELIGGLAGNDRTVWIHDGDECHGNKHPQSLVSTRMADQILIADANFRPALALPNLALARLVAGTGAHNFAEGSSTMLVTKILQGAYPGLDIQTVYHGLMDIDGFTIDYSHHGPHPGSREWLRGNVARFYLRDMMMAALMAGEKPPSLVLRGHFHTKVIETLTMGGFTSTLVIIPAMCVLDDYARQATRSVSTITNGLFAFEVEGSKLVEIHEFTDTLDIRTKERL